MGPCLPGAPVPGKVCSGCRLLVQQVLVQSTPPPSHLILRPGRSSSPTAAQPQLLAASPQPSPLPGHAGRNQAIRTLLAWREDIGGGQIEGLSLLGAETTLTAPLQYSFRRGEKSTQSLPPRQKEGYSAPVGVTLNAGIAEG